MTNSISPWILVVLCCFCFFHLGLFVPLGKGDTPSPHVGLEDAKLQLLVLQREASFFYVRSLVCAKCVHKLF